MAFRTVYERIRKTSNPGDPIASEFGFRKDSKGNDVLVETGKYSLYDEIQSYKDSVDLNKIIERFRITGDVNLLNQRSGFYGDVSEFPKTYAEFLNTANIAREEFAKLPADIRAKFDNSVDKFIASIGSEEFNAIYNPIDPYDIKEKVEEKKSEVKSVE